jgi:polyhydroxyalkanoate synthase
MYLLASDFLLKQAEADDLDPAERERMTFHLQQFVNATSPTLLLLSNPAALRRAMETGGASIADGARNLLGDLKEGRLSMVDATAFAPGRNLALTPGKVVFRNRLIELIQYAPETEQVREVPLLFLPPWINKYYILDMQPKNSMVRYLVQQGFTVFVVSWKNPDASMEGITFEDYMSDGPLAASERAREITGSETVNPVGYCIGGTLLILTLAYLAAQRRRPLRHGDLMVSMQDYAKVGG